MKEGRGGVQEKREGMMVELSLDVFAAQPKALRRRILEKTLLAVGLRPTGRVIAQLLHGAEHGGQGIIAHLADGVAVNKETRRLLFFREAIGPRRRRSGQR